MGIRRVGMVGAGVCDGDCGDSNEDGDGYTTTKKMRGRGTSMNAFEEYWAVTARSIAAAFEMPTHKNMVVARVSISLVLDIAAASFAGARYPD